MLAQPDTLRRLVLAGDLEEPEDADQEVGAPLDGKWVLGVPAPRLVSSRARSHLQACYLSYSLLLLASNVVGSEHPPAEQRVSTGPWERDLRWGGRGGPPCP